MKSQPILQVIQEMVGAQRTLLSAFFDQFHHLRDHEALLDYPRSGQVRALGSIWSFRKHGMGVRFEDEDLKSELTLLEGQGALENVACDSQTFLRLRTAVQ